MGMSKRLKAVIEKAFDNARDDSRKRRDDGGLDFRDATYEDLSTASGRKPEGAKK